MNCEQMLKTFRNGERIGVQEVPQIVLEDFLQAIVDLTGLGWRITSYFGVPEGSGTGLWCVLAGSNQRLGICRSRVDGVLPSITGACPEAHLFEREIAEECGVTLDGHPRPGPVRYQHTLHAGQAGTRQEILPCVGDFYRVDGHEIHEVAVGPVHAGIIEPGHFRFQCHGETVYHLEIALGYQHRGLERALENGPHPATTARMETIAGDTTIAHGIAHAMVHEALAGTEAPPRAHALQAVALELERLANHCGDLGALAGDVGFLPTMSFCGRIRGDFLNATALLCGSRFGRGLVRPGGVYFDCPPRQTTELLARLERIRRDYTGAVALLWDSSSVMARFEKTGTVPYRDAVDLGLVGPAARASGVARDVRRDHPFGAYRALPTAISVESGGDVQARAMLRWKESLVSLDYCAERLGSLPEGELLQSCGASRSDSVAVALVEGWRGELCHVAVTGPDGRYLRYKVKDPSFHNWSGLAMSLRNQQISDFPLCNKSFNLSYCGFDL